MRFVKILLTVGVLTGAGVWVAVTLADNKEKLQNKVQKVSFDAVTVKVTEASQERISDNLSVVGTIVADKDVIVTSETAGRVLQFFVEKGGYVNAGAPLAYIDDELKKANLMMAEAAFEKAEKEVSRFEALSKAKIGTEQQLENVRLQHKNAEAALIVARRQLKDAKILAPISGIVSEKMTEPGETVAPGSPIVNIVDMNSLRLRVNVPEADVVKLKVGEPVQISSEVYPEQKFNGRVLNIGVKGDAMHTFPVEVALGGGVFRAGMYAEAIFASAPTQASLVIPRKALVGGVKKPQVYVASGGRALLRDLVIGKIRDDKVEVLQGISSGEQVVIDGAVNLSDNARITIAQ